MDEIEIGLWGSIIPMSIALLVFDWLFLDSHMFGVLVSKNSAACDFAVRRVVIARLSALGLSHATGTRGG